MVWERWVLELHQQIVREGCLLLAHVNVADLRFFFAATSRRLLSDLLQPVPALTGKSGLKTVFTAIWHMQYLSTAGVFNFLSCALSGWTLSKVENSQRTLFGNTLYRTGLQNVSEHVWSYFWGPPSGGLSGRGPQGTSQTSSAEWLCTSWRMVHSRDSREARAHEAHHI